MQRVKSLSIFGDLGSAGSNQQRQETQYGTETYVQYVIEIEDEGVGISDENIGKLFLDFVKLDEHKKINLSGTGLGLSICKLIVEKMKGRISVKSKVG